MLATEFARKCKTDEFVLCDQRCFVLFELLKREVDSGAIRETTLWCFNSIIEAAFLLAKQEQLLIEDTLELEPTVPAGLYGEQQEFRIRDSMKDIMKVKKANILRALTQLGHARVLLVQSMPKAGD